MRVENVTYRGETSISNLVMLSFTIFCNNKTFNLILHHHSIYYTILLSTYFATNGY